MMSDEQYYREKEIEKQGFWIGVKITLMVVAVIASGIYALMGINI